jgi:hypothetical protein
MKKNKLIGLVTFMVIMLLLGMQLSHAGDPARIGTASGEQVLIPVGARSMALSGANAAYTSGLEAIYWNPAGFSRMNTRAAGMFSTMQYFGDIGVSYLAVGVQAGQFGSFGFSVKSLSFGDIPLTTLEDSDGASGQTFSPSFVTGAITYARALTDAIYVGVSGKLISESVPRASASAFAFDIGIQYQAIGNIPGFSMGLVVKNIGTKIKYDGSAFLAPATDVGATSSDYRSRPTASHQLPATVELGLGYQRQVAEDHMLTFNGNFVNNNFNNDDWKLGLEYMYTDLIALRGGYIFTENVETEDQLFTYSLGLGLHYNISGTDLMFNYAYRAQQYFDGNNLFEFVIGF